MGESKEVYAFVAGEVSPAFHARTDLTKYDLGLAECENFFVEYQGGVSNRPGTEFITAFPYLEMTSKVFKTSGDDYLLLFSPGKLYFARQGGLIVEGSIAASWASGVATVTGHTYAVGDIVFGSFSQGMEASGYSIVASVSGDDLTIVNASGNSVVAPDGESGTFARAYSLSTPFTSGTLSELNFAQDIKRVVITSLDYARHELTYVSDTDWALAAILDGNPVPAPTGLSITTSAAGSTSVGVAVTAVVDGVESPASTMLISNSIVNYSTTSGWAKWSWDAVAGASYYNVYRTLLQNDNAVSSTAQLGYIGRTSGTDFFDPNITPDFIKSPPRDSFPFADGNNPRLYKRFQQRSVYAGTEEYPMTVYGSVPGGDKNFSVSIPVTASDAYSYTIDSEEIQPIRHMATLRTGLLLFTRDSVTMLRGGQDSAITPLNAFAEPQLYSGIGNLSPLNIGLDVLFLEEQGTALNAMVYTEYTNSFKIQDVSVLSSHLFGPENLMVDIEYVSAPNKLVYMPQESGKMLMLTYERDQEVFAWTKYVTQGIYKEVNAVREGARKAPYMLIQRVIDGALVTCLEREASRNFLGIEHAWFVDAGASTELKKPAYTLQVSGVTGSVTVKASGNSFSVGDVDSLIFFAGGKGKIVEYVSPTQVTVSFIRDLTEYLETAGVKIIPVIAAGDWEFGPKVSSVSGLWHLEGKTVSVLIDGNAYVGRVIEDGQLELPAEGAKVTIGLPYVSTATSLPATLRNYPLDGKLRNLRGVAIHLQSTRGIAMGKDKDDQQEIKARTSEAWGETIRTATGKQYQVINSGYDTNGQFTFSQSYPLPASVLGYILDVDIGGF